MKTIVFRSGLFLAFLLVSVFSQMAEAQNYRRSQFVSPAISPYLYLTDRKDSAVDNYNRLVRPRIEMQKAFQAQQTEIDRANREFADYQNRVAQEMATTGKRDSAAPGDFNLNSGGGMRPTMRPSVKPAAGFQNYGHYYPNMSSSRRR